MEDKAIVELVWNRKEKGIEDMSAKYEKYCFAISCRIVNNKEDAEECVNDTYFGAWNAMPDARPGYLSAFLCRIAKNLALKRYKYLLADKRNKSLETAFDELEGVIGTFDIEQDIIIKQAAEAVNVFLKMKSASAQIASQYNP